MTRPAIAAGGLILSGGGDAEAAAAKCPDEQPGHG